MKYQPKNQLIASKYCELNIDGTKVEDFIEDNETCVQSNDLLIDGNNFGVWMNLNQNMELKLRKFNDP